MKAISHLHDTEPSAAIQPWRRRTRHRRVPGRLPLLEPPSMQDDRSPRAPSADCRSFHHARTDARHSTENRWSRSSARPALRRPAKPHERAASSRIFSISVPALPNSISATARAAPATDSSYRSRTASAPDVVAALKARGHDAQSFADWTMKVGGMQAVAVDPATGVMTGAADPRRDGYAVAV